MKNKITRRGKTQNNWVGQALPDNTSVKGKNNLTNCQVEPDLQRRALFNNSGFTLRPSSSRSVGMRDIGAADTLYPALRACGVTERVSRGFTLIELLVVILIIGILAAVALPQYQQATRISKTKKWFPDLKTLQTAQEVYYLRNGKYTNKLEDLDINLPCPRTSSNGHADSYACGPDHFLWMADYPEAASFNYCPGHQNDWGRCFGTCLIAIRLYRWHSTSSYRGKMTCQKVHNSVEERTLCNKLGLITE